MFKTENVYGMSMNILPLLCYFFLVTVYGRSLQVACESLKMSTFINLNVLLDNSAPKSEGSNPKGGILSEGGTKVNGIKVAPRLIYARWFVLNRSVRAKMR